MKYYLTTPIYYVNATPHIGHAYTTLVADTIKRFRRMMGDEAYLCTGTDEHGQKIEQASRNAGWEPKYYADRVSNAFRRDWDELEIDYDFFVRTTEARHAKTVQWLFNRCKENGAVYKGSYTGQYCSNCELYVNDAEPGAPCPDCGRPTETVTEENYFFRLSEFQEKLLDHYENNPRFIQPDTRRNEVMSFVRGGLKDLSISRSSLKWGIRLPEEQGHVFYVWFDALTNYITALGYGGGEPVDPHRLWPADVHLVGKEIVRFHAVYWPAFLMAAGVQLPKQIFAHGWLIFQEEKMSKSRGNIVRAMPIHRVMGIEALRYFLLREIVFGSDGNFSFDALVGRYNSDLANGLGNLSSRTLSMINRYFGGVIAKPESAGGELAELAAETIRRTVECFEKFEFSRGLEAVWALIAAVDKYIVEQKPWVLAKQEDAASRQELETTLYNSAEVVRIVAALIHPVMPKSSAAIWKQLGLDASPADARFADLHWGQLEAGTCIAEVEAVFPRMDLEETIAKMKELEQQAIQEQAEILGKTQQTPPGTAPPEASAPAVPPEPASAAEAHSAEPPAPVEEKSPLISINDFAKVDLRVGVVRSAEKVKKADRLLHLMVDIGEPEPRSIVAGIAEAYAPESLIGRKIVIVANLEPRKLRGLVSQGMVVAASADGGKPALVGFHEDAPVGARLR